jgi:hypothetical protein
LLFKEILKLNTPISFKVSFASCRVPRRFTTASAAAPIRILCSTNKNSQINSTITDFKVNLSFRSGVRVVAYK